MAQEPRSLSSPPRSAYPADAATAPADFNSIAGTRLFIIVDDGSTDATWDHMKQAQKRFPEIRLLRFEKNAGQSAAFYAGFQKARGKWIITMDGDLQNDPSDIPRLLQAVHGHDAVLGYRENRQDHLLRKLSSRVANNFRRRFTRDRARDTGCSLKLFKKEFVHKIPPFKGMHRFYATLLQWEDLEIVEIAVNHRVRQKGHSKYNIRNRVFVSLTDLMAICWMRKRKTPLRINTIRRNLNS